MLLCQLYIYLPWGQRPFSIVSFNSVLNVKALVDTFNQDKALVGAFSVIVKTDCVHTGTVHTVPALQFKLMKGFC